MGVRQLQDLRAWQTSRALKLEVYRLLRDSPGALADFRFKNQLANAAASAESNVAEGFRRFNAGDFSVFLGYALASIEETIGWTQDGIDRGYFADEDCRDAFSHGKRAIGTLTALKNSLRPFLRRTPSGPPVGSKSEKQRSHLARDNEDGNEECSEES